MKSDKKSGKDDVCSVIHCNNPAVTDGYCDTHLERLELIKESYEQAKQLQLRAREDEKGVTLEPGQEVPSTFPQTGGYIE
ncbi:MAG: hypothetical protein ACE5JS_10770 [Nitrospinota bacterium]